MFNWLLSCILEILYLEYWAGVGMYFMLNDYLLLLIQSPLTTFVNKSSFPCSYSIFPISIHFDLLILHRVKGSGVYMLHFASVYLSIIYLSLSLAVIYLYFYLYVSSYPALFLMLSLLLLTPKIPFIFIFTHWNLWISQDVVFSCLHMSSCTRNYDTDLPRSV